VQHLADVARLAYQLDWFSSPTLARDDAPECRARPLLKFETTDPAVSGEMTITYTLTHVDGGSEVQCVHDHIPRGLSLADNEAGSRMALARLAALVEADWNTRA
jgi:activator of Hsp90 ATPase-like protein